MTRRRKAPASDTTGAKTPILPCTACGRALPDAAIAWASDEWLCERCGPTNALWALGHMDRALRILDRWTAVLKERIVLVTDRQEQPK